MRRIAWFALFGLIACSSSRGGSAASTTPSAPATSTSTTVATTTTVAPEAEVKAAYLAYWKMVAGLAAAPDPNDPELEQRATDPVLSAFKDELVTRIAEGRT